MLKKNSQKKTLKQSPAAIKTKLNQLLESVGDMAQKRRAEKMVTSLDLKDNLKILDLGCGNGYYSFLLSQLPFKLNLHGMDSDKRAIDDARKNITKVKIDFKVGSIYKLPFKDNYFDRIILSEVIEHLDTPKKALKEMLRILKPGGILVLSTPNYNYPFFWDPINWTLEKFYKTHIKGGFWAGIWNQHIKLYTFDELDKLLKSAKFKVEYLEGSTWWCIPFNHYLINLAARLIYGGHLPSEVSDSMNKFKADKKTKRPLLINLAFKTLNSIDKLNDLIPVKGGVGIIAKVSK